MKVLICANISCSVMVVALPMVAAGTSIAARPAQTHYTPKLSTNNPNSTRIIQRLLKGHRLQQQQKTRTQTWLCETMKRIPGGRVLAVAPSPADPHQTTRRARGGTRADARDAQPPILRCGTCRRNPLARPTPGRRNPACEHVAEVADVPVDVFSGVDAILKQEEVELDHTSRPRRAGALVDLRTRRTRPHPRRGRHRSAWRTPPASPPPRAVRPPAASRPRAESLD